MLTREQLAAPVLTVAPLLLGTTLSAGGPPPVPRPRRGLFGWAAGTLGGGPMPRIPLGQQPVTK